MRLTIQMFIRSYVQTFIHSYIHTFVHPYVHTFVFPYIQAYIWMNCRCADRNCNHNDSHSEKDLLLSESADDCRPIAGDFHPRQTNRPRFCYADTRNTFPNHAFQPHKKTAFFSLRPSPSADCYIRFRDFTLRMPEFHCKRTDTFASSDFYRFTMPTLAWQGMWCAAPNGICSTSPLPSELGLGWLRSRPPHSRFCAPQIWLPFLLHDLWLTIERGPAENRRPTPPFSDVPSTSLPPNRPHWCRCMIRFR